MTVLPDGTYDVIVVEADDDSHPDEPDKVHLSVTILAGTHKSEVVDLAIENLGRPGFDLLGLPGTLTVSAGLPHLRLDT